MIMENLAFIRLKCVNDHDEECVLNERKWYDLLINPYYIRSIREHIACVDEYGHDLLNHRYTRIEMNNGSVCLVNHFFEDVRDAIECFMTIVPKVKEIEVKGTRNNGPDEDGIYRSKIDEIPE